MNDNSFQFMDPSTWGKPEIPAHFKDKDTKSNTDPILPKNSTARCLFKLYSSDQLLFVSKTPNFQGLVTKPWWLEVNEITVLHFDSAEHLSAAKVQIIKEEKPRYNSRVTA